MWCYPVICRHHLNSRKQITWQILPSRAPSVMVLINFYMNNKIWRSFFVSLKKRKGWRNNVLYHKCHKMCHKNVSVQQVYFHSDWVALQLIERQRASLRCALSLQTNLSLSELCPPVLTTCSQNQVWPSHYGRIYYHHEILYTIYRPFTHTLANCLE